MDVHTDSPRRGLAVALVAAPVLWLAAEALSPALKSDTADQLAVIAAHGDRWYGYTLLLLLGSIVFIPGIVGLARVTRASRRLTAVGSTLLGYGMVVACGDVMSQFFAWQAASAKADRAEMVALFARLDDSPGVGLIFATGGLAFLVGSVLMTIALVRTPSVPTWASVGFGVAMLVQLVGFSSGSILVIAVSAVIALVAVLPIARVLLPMPTTEPAGVR